MSRPAGFVGGRYNKRKQKCSEEKENATENMLARGDRWSKYDVEILIGLWKERYERPLEGTPRQLVRDAKKRLG